MNNNRQWIILGSITVLALFLVFSLQQFITSFLGAVIIYNLAQPIMHYLTERKWKKSNASLIVMLISFFVILLPVFVLSSMLTSKITFVLNHTTEIQDSFKRTEELIFQRFGVHIVTDDTLVKLQNFAAAIVPGFLNAVVNTIFGIIIMYFILYYLLISSGNIQKRISVFLPFSTRDDIVFVKELRSQTISNAIGVPLLALIQGIFCFAGYMIFQVREAAFWSVISGFFSFIPIIGCAIVWIPTALIKILSGEYWQGIGLLLYGGIIISNIDNLFRFMLQKKMADIHPLVTIFGVLVGLKWFGFVGIIFGPLLISYFLILLKMYKSEYLTKDEQNPT